MLRAQSAGPFEPTPAIPFRSSGPLVIRQPALPSHPFTVTGRSGAILGMQDGTVELWQLPTKFFSALHLRAEVEGYPVPIELNPLAAELIVSPDHTTLRYSHAAVTVQQHMFAPAADPDNPADSNTGLGGQILFEIHAVKPVTLTVSLTPAMVQMWPAPQWGSPGWSWQAVGSGGVYGLGTDNPQLFGIIGMPGATPGIVSPYQEHPHTAPLEFRVHFDPEHDAGHMFPLLCELARPGETNTGAGMAVLQQRLLATAKALPEVYARTAAYYDHFFDHRLVVHTPDPQFDRALAWASLAIETSQATIPATATTPAETGLVAGWFPSFASARPGFGWFFGRDTLWSIYAIASYGDRALARRALEFLMRRQRADGKMPHEFSQTAGLLTGDMAWSKLPYEYAAADATPLFLMAMLDYVRATGDLPFLQQHWAALEKAYRFERSHDSDGDGVYDNSQGTGWVEDWPTQPHQELYLAALDHEATQAMAQLAILAGHPDLGSEASITAQKLEAAVRAYRQSEDLYAFSKNADGSYDRTQTVYPAAGLWLHAEGLPAPEQQVEAWASQLFATDWGTRALASNDRAYDPMSYHRGTVWPLFTGWTAMALYRTGHPLAAYLTLRRNLDLTWAHDPGAVTELLSGRFYEPLGRSTTHQMWSSAMVLSPALRELFGVEPDASHHTLYLHPHLPATWNDATLEHVLVGDAEVTLHFHRDGGDMQISAESAQPTSLCLVSAPEVPATATPSTTCTAAPSREHRLRIPLPPLEFSLPDQTLPLPGAETSQPHILAESSTAQQASLLVEAPGETTVLIHLTRNVPATRRAQTEDARINGDTVLRAHARGFRLDAEAGDAPVVSLRPLRMLALLVGVIGVTGAYRYFVAHTTWQRKRRRARRAPRNTPPCSKRCNKAGTPGTRTR